jgi:ribonuclease T
VLGKALQAAGIPWDAGEAHSAAYDAMKTAELFCQVCNRFSDLFPRAETK